MHAGDQCSGVTCRTECQLEVTAGDHAGDGENCPGLLSTRGDGVLVTLNPIGGPGGRTAVREVRSLGRGSLRGCSGCGLAGGIRICCNILAIPGGMSRPFSCGGCSELGVGSGVRCPSGVLTTTMRDACSGVIAPVSCRYESACLDMGRGAPAGLPWRSGASRAVCDRASPCCSWGRLRRGLPGCAVTDCRLLTPRGTLAGGALRRDFLSAGFPDR